MSSTKSQCKRASDLFQSIETKNMDKLKIIILIVLLVLSNQITQNVNGTITERPNDSEISIESTTEAIKTTMGTTKPSSVSSTVGPKQSGENETIIQTTRGRMVEFIESSTKPMDNNALHKNLTVQRTDSITNVVIVTVCICYFGLFFMCLTVSIVRRWRRKTMFPYKVSYSRMKHDREDLEGLTDDSKRNGADYQGALALHDL